MSRIGERRALNWSHRWFKVGRGTSPDDMAAVFPHGPVREPEPAR